MNLHESSELNAGLMRQSDLLPTSSAEIRAILAALPAASEESAAAVRTRQAELTKPAGSLGRLEDIVAFLAVWQGRAMPTLEHPLVLVFAGNHGITRRGVSAYPASVTQAMVANFAAGGAAVNQICAAFGLSLKVVECDLDCPTQDFSETAAMDEARLIADFRRGMEAIAPDIDLICIGEMGIGNSTSAAAIYCALYGGGAAAWVGRGAGIDDDGLARKIDTIDRALVVKTRLAIRSKSFAASAAMRSRPWLARLSRRDFAAFPSCSTAISPAPRRRFSKPRPRTRSTIVLPVISRAMARIATCWPSSAKNLCSILACVSARAAAPRWRRAS